MHSHPVHIADDMARCILQGTPGRDKALEKQEFDACISIETSGHIRRIGLAHDQIDALGQLIDTMRNESGQLPASLAEFPGPMTTGPWGHDMHYARTPEGNYELCVLGPDGQHGTADDRCHTPFIFFQF